MAAKTSMRAAVRFLAVACFTTIVMMSSSSVGLDSTPEPWEDKLYRGSAPKIPNHCLKLQFTSIVDMYKICCCYRCGHISCVKIRCCYRCGHISSGTSAEPSAQGSELFPRDGFAGAPNAPGQCRAPTMASTVRRHHIREPIRRPSTQHDQALACDRETLAPVNTRQREQRP